MIQALGYFAAILVAAFVAGTRLSILLLPEKYQMYRLHLAPFLGLGLIEILMQNFNAMGLPADRSAWPVLGFFCLMESVFAVKTAFSSQKQIYAKINFVPFLPGLFSAFILLGPFIDIGYLTCFGGGTDATGYIRYAYFLQHNPIYAATAIPESAGPWYGWVFAAIRTDFLGSSYLLGFFSAIFSRDPLYLFNAVMAAYGFLAPLAVYLVMGMCLGQSQRLSVLCACLMCCQNFWQMPGYSAFLNQMSAIPYFILVFGFIYLCLKEQSRRLYVLAGLLVTVLMSHYSVVLALLAPVALAAVFVAAARTGGKVLKNTAIGFGIIAFTVLISLQMISGFTYATQAHYALPPSLEKIVNKKYCEHLKGLLNQYMARGFETGTFRPSDASGPFLDASKPSADMPKYISGFFNLERTYKTWIKRSVLEKIVYSGFSLLFILLAYASIFIINGEVRAYFAASMVIFTLFMLYPASTNYWYGLWKTMTFVQFIFITGIAVTLVRLWDRTEFNKNRRRTYAFLAVFAAHNFFKDMEMIHRPFAVCGKELLAVEKLVPQIRQKLHEGEGLMVDIPETDADAYEIAMLSYMLKEAQVIIPERSQALKYLFFTDYKQVKLKPVVKLQKTRGVYAVAENL